MPAAQSRRMPEYTDSAAKAGNAGAENHAAEISDLIKIYGSGPYAFEALRDINLNIRANEFFTLLGPSGCGKTTLNTIHSISI